jgi:hypothetical protein
MKKVMLIVAAIAAILVMSFAVVGLENYVRWNNQMDECVYYYDKGDARAHCFVAETNCEMKDGRNHEKELAAVECSSEPLNPKNRVTTSAECVEFVEGDLIVLKYDGDDPDNDDLEYTFESPFDNDDRSWQTERGDAGNYEVEVTVTDGEYTDKAIVCFDILAANHAPKLTVRDVTASEGTTVNLAPECEDEDGDAVRLSFNGDMDRAVWETSYDDAGEYTVTVTCTDTEGESDRETITVTIEDVNRKPSLTGVEDVTVKETELVSLNPRCVDPEGDDVTITYTGAMTTDKWKTSYADEGEYDVTVTCEDASGLSTSEDITVTVLNQNRPPMITAMVIQG